ncbi:MAG: glycosyltransferase family 4 protein [Anaerolineae bacterium]|nr:glycosyltransferase family 4 protein [Anaerolineae bacterium]MDW8072036.1 glycosyltransferase family 1 protein [Anaerolineae bacterium]
MKVILDARTANDHFPGIGRYVASLARALMQLEKAPELTLLVDPKAQPGRLQLPSLPILSCPASPFSLRQQWLVPHVLRIAHAHVYHSPYYLMPYRPGVPIVLTCHDIIPLLFPDYFTAWQRLAFHLSHQLALHVAEVILVVSQTTRDDLMRHLHVAAHKITVIPEGVDEHFRPQTPEEIERVRHIYRLPTYYVLYVGSNKPHKNLVRLVQAWAVVAPHHRDVFLVIAGPWDARYPQARRAVEELGIQEHVLFLGAVADEHLPGLYSGALCFVSPSLYEGFGLPVLEAMACGTPVACSDVASLPEVAGDAALFFDPHKVECIQDALMRLLSDADLRDDLAMRGRERAITFSWKRTAAATAEQYARLVCW